MIRRLTLTLAVALLGASWLGAGAIAPARASSPNEQMRQAVLALRGLIDRKGAERYFTYPTRSTVRPGRLDSPWWPRNPWTGSLLYPGTSRGHYEYRVSRDRRSYRLTGYLSGGARVIFSGGMPRTIMLAYDHRSEEGINLIRQYIEAHAAAHEGVYPLPGDVEADGPVGQEPQHRYWPSNPWDHQNMTQRGDRGSFSYSVAADRSSYTLRLHRALKADYVVVGSRVTSPWQRLLTTLEDEILRRSGRILRGYVEQWSLQHGGALPAVADMAPTAAVGAAHADWPRDPVGGGAMAPGADPGSFAYVPQAARAYTLTVHLHSGDYQAGGVAPSPAAPARAGSPE